MRGGWVANWGLYVKDKKKSQLKRICQNVMKERRTGTFMFDMLHSIRGLFPSMERKAKNSSVDPDHARMR